MNAAKRVNARVVPAGLAFANSKVAAETAQAFKL